MAKACTWSLPDAAGVRFTSTRTMPALSAGSPTRRTSSGYAESRSESRAARAPSVTTTTRRDPGRVRRWSEASASARPRSPSTSPAVTRPTAASSLRTSCSQGETTRGSRPASIIRASAPGVSRCSAPRKASSASASRERPAGFTADIEALASMTKATCSASKRPPRVSGRAAASASAASASASRIKDTCGTRRRKGCLAIRSRSAARQSQIELTRWRSRWTRRT
jgi:hypothetical protein